MGFSKVVVSCTCSLLERGRHGLDVLLQCTIDIHMAGPSRERNTVLKVIVDTKTEGEIIGKAAMKG